MRELKVTLETVTPLFLGGADPRGTPELRAPSFRGAIRYWLRAALGGAIRDLNLKELHNLEAAVFGSTDRASPVSIRLAPLGNQLQDKTHKILPHKEGPQAGSRRAFADNQQFQLVMWMPRHAEMAVWRAAVTSLRLALTFGGVGLRSRRGYGTLKVVQSSDPVLMPPMPASLKDWKQYVVQTAEQAAQAVRQLAQSHNVPIMAQLPAGPSSFPSANKTCSIHIWKENKPSAMEAVKQLMATIPRNAAFGGIQPRQASPLWVRPIQIENGFSLLFVVLASKLKAGTNYQIIQDFLNEHFSSDTLLAKGWNI